MLDRFPVLRKALFNQYQLILSGGAIAFSLLFANPLPLLLLLGGEFLALPLLMDRLRRRLDIEKEHEARQAGAVGQEQQYAELSPQSKGRFHALRRLCEQIQQNYRSLSPASQDIVGEQTQKFEAIQVSCLRRLWLVKKYDEMDASFDEDAVVSDVAKIRKALESEGIEQRVRDAWAQNLSIKERLVETVKRNESNKAALLAELDSLESLLQLLMQKSLAATDAESFTAAIDDVLAQAEADAKSVEEMEQILGALPELANHATLADRVRSAASAPPPIPPPRIPQGPSGRR